MSPAAGVPAAIVLAGVASGVVFLNVALALVRFVRVSVPRAVVGFGPRLLAFGLRGTRIEIRLVPLQSYIVPIGGNPYADDPPPEAPWLAWPDASPWRRVVAFVVAPRLASFALSLAVLGPARAGRAVVRGASELFAAFGGSHAVLDAGAAVLEREGLVVLTALALCKGISLSAFALPTDIAYALQRRSVEGRSEKTLAKVRALVLLALFGLYAAWFVAWVRWVV